MIKECSCSDFDVERYRRKISGPIVDRIDLWVEVPHVPYEELLDTKSNTKEEDRQKQMQYGNQMRTDILRTRSTQSKRFQKDLLNAHMKAQDIEQHAKLTPESESILVEYSKKFNLSPRSFYRMKKIARTIADISGSENVEIPHVLEAFQYRPKMQE
jgi:magnesium chelatase family protein